MNIDLYLSCRDVSLGVYIREHKVRILEMLLFKFITNENDFDNIVVETMLSLFVH